MEDSAFFDGPGWATFVSDIQNKYLGPNNSPEELYFLFDRLLRALQRKSALFWHHLYLKKYIDAKIVPFGLRVQFFPTIPTIGDSLKLQWKENLTKCSCGMMDLLRNHYATALDE